MLSQPSSLELDTSREDRQELLWFLHGLVTGLRSTRPAMSPQASCRGCPLVGGACHLMLICVLLQDVEEPEAKAAVIWILGEHGYTIQVSRLPDLRLRCCQQCLCCRSKHASLSAAAQCLTGLSGIAMSNRVFTWLEDRCSRLSQLHAVSSAHDELQPASLTAPAVCCRRMQLVCWGCSAALGGLF